MKINPNVLNTRATALMILKKPMPPISFGE
jgi:hypothetical protein